MRCMVRNKSTFYYASYIGETEIADEEHVLVKTTASLSPTFYGWIFEFAGRIRIVSPEHAKNELKAMVGRLQETL